MQPDADDVPEPPTERIYMVEIPLKDWIRIRDETNDLIKGALITLEINTLVAIHVAAKIDKFPEELKEEPKKNFSLETGENIPNEPSA